MGTQSVSQFKFKRKVQRLVLLHVHSSEWKRRLNKKLTSRLKFQPITMKRG